MNALQDIEKKAMHLEQAERAMLAEYLIASLDSGEYVDAENLWVKEAEARYAAFQQEKISSAPASEVLTRARKNLK